MKINPSLSDCSIMIAKDQYCFNCVFSSPVALGHMSICHKWRLEFFPLETFCSVEFFYTYQGERVIESLVERGTE